jgi:hypothetical protein
METKTLVIFLAGGVAGYLMSQYLNGKIEGAQPISPTPSPSTGQLDPKFLDCQSKLNIELANVRLVPEKEQEFRDSFMRDCLSNN